MRRRQVKGSKERQKEAKQAIKKKGENKQGKSYVRRSKTNTGNKNRQGQTQARRK